MGRLGTSFLPALLGALCLAVLAAPKAAALDYNCPDFANQAEAEEYLLPGDPYHLDADNDGIACEDLPCPCSSTPGGGGGEPGGGESTTAEPPKPPRLNKAVARRAAMHKAHRYARHNPRISRLSFKGCRRRTRHKVRCGFVGRGRTSTAKVGCHITVVVTGEGSHAHARLRAACRSRRRP